jgi:nuclear pore complex protein Nup93
MNQAPQQSNTLGNTQQTTAGGLFGGLGSQQQQQQQQQQPSAPLAQSGAAGTSALFDHLLERGRKRNAGENGLNSFDELPTLQLGLGDIARKVRNLGAGGPSADQNQDRAA